MPATVAAEPQTANDLVPLILALDDLAVDAPTAAARASAARRADELRERHLMLFHAEFSSASAEYKSAVKGLKQATKVAKDLVDQIAKAAETLAAIASVIAAVDSVLATAIKIGMV